MDKIKEEIYCQDCGVEFHISYNEEDELVYCPFCGSDDILEDEEDDDWEEDYWEDENE